jgi:hypothetical protein
MQNDANWIMKYYSPAAQAKIAERAKSFTPDMQVQVSQAWERQRELLRAFTGNDPEVEAGLKALYKDRANWPAGMKERMKNYGA